MGDSKDCICLTLFIIYRFNPRLENKVSIDVSLDQQRSLDEYLFPPPAIYRGVTAIRLLRPKPCFPAVLSGTHTRAVIARAKSKRPHLKDEVFDMIRSLESNPPQHAGRRQLCGSKPQGMLLNR